ncbi:MAG: PorT family protein [Muribaculaceae bacterium]|nr:PorT family protein [Muribaculaceae bacterium]
MKKVLLMLAATLMAVSASAQVVSSRTFVKSKTETVWYARLGMSINNIAGTDTDNYDSVGSKMGMDIDFGFNRAIGKSGLYWSMELGIGTRGYSSEYEDRYDGDVKAGLLAWNVKYSPFTIGYKYSLTDNIKLDGHLGGFVSYDFSGKLTEKFYFEGDHHGDDSDSWSLSELDGYQKFDAGMQVGIGVWYKKFNFDITYQRGFIDMSDEASGTSSNLMFRVGYAF